MMTGLFSEVVKALVSDADKAFSSGILGRAITNAAKPPDIAAGGRNRSTNQNLNQLPHQPVNIQEAAKTALHSSVMGFGGGNRTAVAPNPLPVLHQILEVLEAIASLLHIQIRATPNAPSGPSIRQNVREMVERGQWRGIARPVKQPGGYNGMPPINPKPGTPTPTTGGGLAAGLLGMLRLAGIASLVAGAFAAAVASIRSFVEGVSNTNRELAKYSGQLAASVVKLDVTRLQLDVRQANAVAPAGEQLNEAIGELMVEFQPIRQLLGVAVTNMATIATRMAKIAISTDVLAGIVSAVVPGMGNVLKDMLDQQKKNQDKPGPLNIDLRALQKPGAPANMPGGKINPLGVPNFLPPLVKPGRQNPGGILPPGGK